MTIAILRAHEAGVDHRPLDAVRALLDGRLGQADQHGLGQRAGRDVDLDLDRHGVDAHAAKRCGAWRAWALPVRGRVGVRIVRGRQDRRYCSTGECGCRQPMDVNRMGRRGRVAVYYGVEPPNETFRALPTELSRKVKFVNSPPFSNT